MSTKLNSDLEQDPCYNLIVDKKPQTRTRSYPDACYNTNIRSTELNSDPEPDPCYKLIESSKLN